MLAARLSWVGPSFLSTIRQETPCRFSSAAMNRPAGPAPTTNTWVSLAIRYPKTLPRLPRISHCARAGVGVGARCELAAELAEQRDAVGEAKLSARRSKCGVLHRKRTVDDKARSGKRLEHRLSASDRSPSRVPRRPGHATPAPHWNRPPEPGRSARPTRSLYQ